MKKYSQKEKKRYYKNRMNDKSLTEGQASILSKYSCQHNREVR